MPQLDAMMKRQQVLADFGDLAIHSEDLTEVLTEACRLVGEALGTERTKVLEITKSGAELFVRAGVGWQDDVVGKLRLPMSEHSSESYSIKAGEPVITRNIADEDRFDVPQFLKDAGVVAFVNVPILVPGAKPYGILQVDSTEPREFDNDDIQFLRTYAGVLGPVIHRLQLAGERRTVEEQRSADFAAMEELQRVSTELVGEHEPETLYRRIIDAAAVLTKSDAASIQTLDTTTGQLKLAAWRGFHPESAKFWEWVKADTGSSCGRALEANERIVVPDMDQFDGDPHDVEAYRRSGLLSVQSTPLRAYSGQVVGMLSTHWRDRRELSPGEYRYFDLLARLAADLIERIQAADRLRESEERLRQFGEASLDVLWIRDAEKLQWQYLTPAFEAIYGLSRDEALSGDNFNNWLDLILAEDRDHAAASIERVRRGERMTFDYRIRRPADGAIRWLRNTDFPITDADGDVKLIGGVGHDLTEVREAEVRLQVLVAELQHRTRNLLGVVRSMSDKTARASADLPDFRTRFRERLEALSRVQGLLSRLNEHDRVTFDELIETELSAMNGAADRVSLSGPRGVRLRSSTVQTLAMAIHELATNAVKYGAIGQSQGKLEVSWSLEKDGAGGKPWLHIDWRESGVTMPPAGASPTGGGQGRELIERALPYQLSAETAYELGREGVHCTISLPISASNGVSEMAHV